RGCCLYHPEVLACEQQIEDGWTHPRRPGAARMPYLADSHDPSAPLDWAHSFPWILFLTMDYGSRIYGSILCIDVACGSAPGAASSCSPQGGAGDDLRGRPHPRLVPRPSPGLEDVERPGL